MCTLLSEHARLTWHSCCHMQELEKPELTYRKLGAKLVVGMPFKDQATSDTLLMPEVPSSSDKDKRRALARLQVRRPPAIRPPEAQT